MARTSRRRISTLQEIPNNQVRLTGGLLAQRNTVNREATLPVEYDRCRETGRLNAWKLDWKPGEPNQPHYFWDSDVGKWLEAVGYSLADHPDPGLQARADEVIGWIEKAQQDDGYLNIYFTVVAPEQRWVNLCVQHELYCAGHLMEAAVAYWRGTGDRRLLDVLCRYADHIDTVFGPGPGQKKGYPGHEEIELALVKMYRATGEERYLALSKFFVDQRGTQPHYFEIEARERGEERPGHAFDYCQAHKPVREQDTVVGHAVRAMYLYAGMADVALETSDRTLLTACRRLWDNLAGKRMYVTGGIGPIRDNEGFTEDYDLPNETSYAETCAAIGLVFWAHRMSRLDPDARYADVMERAIYNGVLSGISLDGERFFYANPHAAWPRGERSAPDSPGPVKRQEWFGCACCPPNIARLLASLGGYVFSSAPKGLWVHLYTSAETEVEVAGQPVKIRMKTDYPWREKVQLTVKPPNPLQFELALRLPGWCRKPALKVNGKNVALGPLTKKGYARIERTWQPGDKVELTLPMPVERVEAHPKVRQDAGRVALQRGPVVYCLEEVDNGGDLGDLGIERGAKLRATFRSDLLGGVTVITGRARRRDQKTWNGDLYRADPSRTTTQAFMAVPYFAWSNRRPGEMRLWLRDLG